MASAELLKMTHSVDGKVQDLRSDVRDVGDKVEGKMQTIGNTISSRVQGVDDKLEQVNSSLSL